MKYLLDTNVLSELVKPSPSRKVVRWIEKQSALDLSISCLTLGEITEGIRRLPEHSVRRLELEAWVTHDLTARFRGRIHGIDAHVADAWGTMLANASLSGRPLPAVDGLLLATASFNKLTFVTRNETDCSNRGVIIFNPWN